MSNKIQYSFAAALALVFTPGCNPSSSSTGQECDGAKCDTPDQTAATNCLKKLTDEEHAEFQEDVQLVATKCPTRGGRIDWDALGEMDARFVNGQCWTGAVEAYDECRYEAGIGFCQARAGDALKGAQQAFTENAIRWSCSDVAGVNTENSDSRGQEYCEYFAVIKPPGSDQGVVLGRGQEPLGLELDRDDVDALEDARDDAAANGETEPVVGMCIFTSWHSDVEGEGPDQTLPICRDGDCSLRFPEGTARPSTDRSMDLGITLDASGFRMLEGVNSNRAAADLVEQCLQNPLQGDPENEADPLHDDYVRGCMKANELFGTEWRQSDSEVCVVGTRLTECGCFVDANGNGELDEGDVTNPILIGDALVPAQPGMEIDTNGDGERDSVVDPDSDVTFRGFQLGTWNSTEELAGIDNLPPGCSRISTGDVQNDRNIVGCEITITEFILSQQDPKNFCRERYGDEVVVHVPIPAAAIVCQGSDSPYAGNCPAQPWVLTSELDCSGIDALCEDGTEWSVEACGCVPVEAAE